MLKMLKKRTLSLVIIIMALLSCLAIGLTGAKYLSQFKGTATMQTAKFDVSVVGEPTNFVLSQQNDTASFNFTVKSASEVQVSYDVVITLPEALISADIVTFKIGENVASPDSTGLVYTIANVGSFTANGGSNDHALTVTANDFTYEINLIGIKIEVVATQVQPTV